MPRFAFQVLALLLLAVLAGPLWALKVTLKSEEKPIDVTPLRLEGGNVVVKRGSKEMTYALDDFVAESAFEIRKSLTAREARPLMALARFALHRDLYAQARDSAREAASLDASLATEQQEVVSLSDTLEAEALYARANAEIDAADAEGARKTLTGLMQRFKDSPAARRAQALLSVLDQLAAEIKARQLQEEARKAQEAADAELKKKRQPIDDWLYEFEVQLGKDERRLSEADGDARAGHTGRGLGAMEEIVNNCAKARESLVKNESYLIYKGQKERAAAISERAKRLMVDTYERWVSHLFAMKNFAFASKVCERGLELDPKDRRLLALKVDIDEVYDKKSVLDGISPPGSGD
ncbi:MAG: hypothetical protein HUU03_10740 [Planctomycetaceae bacterium]|nr:hypothetical protein [Planctomycetota bacterium]MCQ3950253.1 hypothetical protein [Planctomycetota bacterium]NUO16903.1 hypothetical protein [Planctomycetaceae bacterium]GIK51920.1 MAG: hypothetical protein BroJett014_08930 [Planctomycetota bacterium]HRJ79389.1 hypothetical protein [Planctomycetota bacterium]